MKRALIDLLRCPDCHSDLRLHDETPEQPEVESGRLLCIPCNIAYPIVGGIPRFMKCDGHSDRLFRVTSGIWRVVWQPFPIWVLSARHWLLVTLPSCLWRKPNLEPIGPAQRRRSRIS